MQELINNSLNLAYLCREMHISKRKLEEHEQRFQYFTTAFLNNKRIRALKFHYIGQYVRMGFDVDDLNAEADKIILNTAWYYFDGKAEGEITAYLSKVFPMCLKSALAGMRSRERSLDEMENVEELFEKHSFKEADICTDVRRVIEGLDGNIKAVADLLLQGYNLKEIEGKLGLGCGLAWYYKERLAKKLRPLVEDCMEEEDT